MLPDCSVAADAILAEADRRMYRDKRKRKAARASAMDDIANLAASVGRGGRPEPATAGAAESLIGVS
jgi:hypothetical protein